jgi:dienelactone hydrolase
MATDKSQVCCPTDRQATRGEFSGQIGSKIQIPVSNDVSSAALDCFVSTSANSSAPWLILVYDIFGVHPNNHLLATFMNEKGINVAIPDLFGGNNWPRDQFPVPSDKRDAFSTFMQIQADPQSRAEGVRKCIEYIRSTHRASSIALLGLCWGFKLCSLIGSHDGIVRCMVGAHPSLLTSQDGDNVSVPTLILPTADDNLTRYLAGVVRNRNPKLVRVSEEYLGSFHGFLGARGDWASPDEWPLAHKALTEISTFIISYCQ